MPYDSKTGINSETGLTRKQEELLTSPAARKERRKTEARISEVKNLREKEIRKIKAKRKQKIKSLKTEISKLKSLLKKI